MSYDNTNSGALFKNDNKQIENHPDYKGGLEVKCPCCNENSNYWMSAWIKTAGPNAKKPGSKFFSVAINPKEERTEQSASEKIGEDDIPF